MDPISNNEQADAQLPQDLLVSPRRKRRPPWKAMLHILFTLAVATAMWHIVWWTVELRHAWLHSLFVPLAVTTVIGLLILRHDQKWSRPIRQIVELMPLISAGEAPIEELAKIKAGGVSPLLPLIQDVFHDLRKQRTVVAKLNEEMHQRVATRTNALERQINTLKLQSTRDSLTGLFNRRMFDSYLPPVVERSIAEKTDLSLLMIDVDNFKCLNDTLGHAAGDGLLRDIGQIIRSGVRDQDAPFRLGGDEFVIILSGAPPDAAQGLATRLMQLVDALVKPLRLPRQPGLSIGVASLSEIANASPLQLIQAADKQLYKVKASRRQAATAPLAKSA